MPLTLVTWNHFVCLQYTVQNIFLTFPTTSHIISKYLGCAGLVSMLTPCLVSLLHITCKTELILYYNWGKAQTCTHKGKKKEMLLITLDNYFQHYSTLNWYHFVHLFVICSGSASCSQIQMAQEEAGQRQHAYTLTFVKNLVMC